MSSILNEWDANYLTTCITAVTMVAAWVVEDEDAWVKFQEFVKETCTNELPPNAREFTDEAIGMLDMLRATICIETGRNPGTLYPRKFG